MGPLSSKFVGDVARTIGKALLAGVGMELAKVIGEHLRRRVGPKPDAPGGSALTDDAQRASEVERLRMENARLRDELAAAKATQTATEATAAETHNS